MVARHASIGAEVRINEGSGFRRENYILTGDVKLDEQYNIELDFEAPDVPTITDLRVTIPAYQTVRTALLFMRHRFYASRQEKPDARVLERESSPRATDAPEPAGVAGASRLQTVADAPRRVAETFQPEQPTQATVRPPWQPREPESSNGSLNDPNRPRRRRLE